MDNKVMNTASILTGIRPGTIAAKVTPSEEIEKSFTGLYKKRVEQKDLRRRYMELPAEYRNAQVIKDIDLLLCIDPDKFNSEKQRIENRLSESKRDIQSDINKVKKALTKAKISLDDFNARKLRFAERFNGPITANNLAEYKKLYDEFLEKGYL